MATTTSTRKLWADLVAMIARERDAAPDLLQRHLLCDATGLHDRGPDGRCRDCTKVLDPDDPVCRDEVHPPIGGRR